MQFCTNPQNTNNMQHNTNLQNVFAATLQNPVHKLRAGLYTLIMTQHKPLDEPTENPQLYDLAENILCTILADVYLALNLTGENPDSQNEIYDAFEQYIYANCPSSY